MYLSTHIRLLSMGLLILVSWVQVPSWEVVWVFFGELMICDHTIQLDILWLLESIPVDSLALTEDTRTQRFYSTWKQVHWDRNWFWTLNENNNKNNNNSTSLLFLWKLLHEKPSVLMNKFRNVRFVTSSIIPKLVCGFSNATMWKRRLK